MLEGDVVDRREWVRAAAQGLSEITGLALRSRGSGGDPLGGLGARGAGLQAGLVLSYLGTKVLGQYDPFPVSYTHLRAHETVLDLVCRLLLEKKK